jgi:ketopantoate reductase
MRICVYGAGAIGRYLAVELALAGHDISVIARGAEHARVIPCRNRRNLLLTADDALEPTGSDRVEVNCGALSSACWALSAQMT